MADDSPHSSTVNLDDKQPQIEAKVEDAETRATREELKHSHISDKQANTTTTEPSTQDDEDDEDDEDMRLRSGREFEFQPKKKTPDLSPPEALSAGGAGKRKVSSPKKKRAHDEVEEHKDGEGRTSNGADSDDWVMVEEGDKAEKDQAEPQKKRARDEKSPPADIHKTATATISSTSSIDSVSKDQPQTSASAFEASGFAKLASSTVSPFASIGANKSAFGGGAAASPSPFASFGGASTAPSTAAPVIPPKLTFGTQDASGQSPFGTINGNKPTSGFGGGFGSAFGGGGGSAFGSVLGGERTGNFASPGQLPITMSDKPAKPFGAPESDAEDEDEDDTEAGDEEGGPSGGGEADKEKEKEDTASRDESTPVGGDDEKKKFKRVAVDDGEAGEATIVQVRARMYYLDKSTSADGKPEAAWKERGVGNLKINVPEDSVSIDPETGAVNPKSFNPAVLKESTPENPKLVRLVMRQDSTGRVILNTVMLAGMAIQMKEGFKKTSVLFTAIEGEGGKHVPVTMKMSPQNAATFSDKAEIIKRKLKDQIVRDQNAEADE
ncbi:Nucleoporin NUP56 [Cytospora mali]|uniref:Nucleoporin NUP56 n=1 Tax=Cytospora mali TaxID=578113 RepID=A0A194UYX0_CYTMA|nr:Nucleoporin NUP56 [Valsa mali var. pyri (nom. inval.)]